MKSLKHNLPPHIIAGTNFNVQRFEELYGWIEASKADAILANGTTYGLLCGKNGIQRFELSLDGDKLRLSECLARTATGVLLGHFSETNAPLALDVSSQLFENHDQLDVYLVADIQGKRLPIGAPDKMEIPLRAPFSRIALRLETHPVEHTSMVAKFDALKIGKLILEKDNILLQDYIPACAEIGAYNFFWKKQQEYLKYIKEFYESLINIIKSIEREKENILIVSFGDLCKEIGRHLAAQISQLKRIDSQTNPLEFIEIINALVYVIDFEWQTTKRFTELQELVDYNTRNSIQGFDFGVVEDFKMHIHQQDETLRTIQQLDRFMSGFILPMISIGKQNRILNKVERTGWEEKKNTRNVW